MSNKIVLNISLELTREHFQLSAQMQSKASCIAIVGPSGSGKSTLLRILAGLEKSARGSVSFQGSTWLDSKQNVFVPPWRRRLGYVPQDSLLIPTLNVFDNLNFTNASSSEVKTIANLLLIESLLYRRPRMLSGGEKQRVALGRALLSNPSLLLLDEPFSALDRKLRKCVSETLRSICIERQLPLILISHDESDVLSLAQEAWSIVDGTLRPVSLG